MGVYKCEQISRSLFSRIPSHSLPSSSAASKHSLPTSSPSTTRFTRTSNPNPMDCQNVIVMRHGERMDNFVESWLSEAARPWDPPLFKAGRERAFQMGVELRTKLGFPIHRVVVSPFMRCVETGFELVSALSTVGEKANALPGAVTPINPPPIKTCVEFGLCEMFNRVAIRTPSEDGNWGFNLSEIKLKLPNGTVDPDYEPVDSELPNWGETEEDARARFERVLRALADKHPFENLLLITHGEGLRATVSTFLNGTKISKVQYCAYVKLRRQILPSDEDSFSAGEFAVASHHGYLLKEKGA